jgi:hypothetical protein
MSRKAQAILEEIKTLPPQEFQAVWRQVNRMAAESQKPATPLTSPSDEEFEAALDEVTGCAVGSNSLQRLLDDRRRDRERDEARLEARKRERSRG